MTLEEIIAKLGEIKGNYNCFDESEEPYYHACAEAIQAIKHYSKIKKIIDYWNSHPDTLGDEQDVDYYFNRIIEKFEET